MRQRWLGLAVGAVLTASSLITITAQAKPSAPPPLDPGCAASRPVIVHDGGGTVRPKGSGMAVSCSVQTGYPTSETRIGVTNTGAVLQEPAIAPTAGVGTPPFMLNPLPPGGFAVTHDRGRTWDHSRPTVIGGAGVDDPEWDTQDVSIWVDRDTGRVFSSNPNTKFPTSVAWSADDGHTWHETRAVCCHSPENAQFVFARPTVSQTSGYPNVVYFCANTTWLGTTARLCMKSLDGGNTWATLGQGFTGQNGVPAHPECGSSREEFSPSGEAYPAAVSSGRLYLVVSCGGSHFLAASDDEGATWPVLRDANGNPITIAHLQGQDAPVLRSDSANNLYVFRQVDNKILMSVSTDRGLTWSPERDLVPPGVETVGKWNVATRAPGNAAAAFYGTRTGQTTLDAWITSTRNATAATPTFVSGMLNDPDSPVLWQKGGNAPWLFLDYIGIDIGPDGTPWASFIQDCGPSLGDSTACQAMPPQRTTAPNVGFVGHLQLRA
jgi:hypothetical protein